MIFGKLKDDVEMAEIELDAPDVRDSGAHADGDWKVGNYGPAWEWARPMRDEAAAMRSGALRLWSVQVGYNRVMLDARRRDSGDEHELSLTTGYQAPIDLSEGTALELIEDIQEASAWLWPSERHEQWTGPGCDG